MQSTIMFVEVKYSLKKLKFINDCRTDNYSHYNISNKLFLKCINKL